MIKLSRLFIIPVLSLFCITSITAQIEEYIELNIDELVIGENVDPQVGTAIMDAITKTINDYNKYGKLIDPETGTFSFEISENFQGLFRSNAGVFNDLSKYQETMNIRDYVTEVYEYLPDEGVNFMIPEDGAALTSITFDAAGFYSGTVMITKVMYIGLAEDKSKVDFPDGKTLPLQFTFDIPEDDLTDARIYEIKGQAEKKKARAKSRMSAAGRYGYGLLTGGSETVFASTLEDIPVDYSNSLDAGVDILYKRSFGNSGKMYLVAGLNGGISSIQTKVSNNFEYTYTGGSATFPSDINVSYQSGSSDKTTYYYAGVPLGISYHLKENFKSDIFLDVLLLPGYILSSTGEYNGSIVFSEKLLGIDIDDDSNVKCGFGAYSFGSDTSGVNSNDPAYSPDFSGYQLGIRVAPVYDMEIGYSWGLELGLDVSYYFITGFKTADNGNIFAENFHLNNNVTEPVKIELDNSSLLSTLNSSMTNLQVGARIGIYYRFD